MNLLDPAYQHQLKIDQYDREKQAYEEKLAKLKKHRSQHIDLLNHYRDYQHSFSHSRAYFHRFRQKAKNVYAHQDKLIHVLEDYLHYRESQLKAYQAKLISHEVELTWDSKIMLEHVDQLLKKSNY